MSITCGAVQCELKCVCMRCGTRTWFADAAQHADAFLLSAPSLLPRGGHLRRNNCSASFAAQLFHLQLRFTPQLFLNCCDDACAASILAILSAIVQVKYDYE